MKYDAHKIEEKWQKRWEKEKIYLTKEDPKNPKCYVLDMFPYPSGEGLHVGHPKGYIATDIYSRFKAMQGYSVLHPMGWDAFGLPAENYAIKNKIHPRLAVNRNIKRFKEQLSKLGLSYDWSREINTTDPTYYKWTQWIFLQMFEHGLAYESMEPINWCPSCKTGLANEDLEGNHCERCGSVVEKKPMRQWVLKITEYADRLLKDLDQLDWPESVKESQRNWIGRSEGAMIKFKVQSAKFKTTGQKSKVNEIEVFTTRADTLFGATYLVVAPEHPITTNSEYGILNIEEIQNYVQKSLNKTPIERQADQKIKTGVELRGIKAINPASGNEIPIWVADYVLAEYGTGAIMGVPAHDARDYEFAKKFELPIEKVIEPHALAHIIRSAEDIAMGAPSEMKIESDCFAGEGKLLHSGQFTGMTSQKARGEIVGWLEEKGLAKKQTQYKLRDWVFSRQRYWGEPIPLIFCESCKKQAESLKLKTKNLKRSAGELINPGWVAVPYDKLPVTLPEVEHYQPSGTGESPLAAIPSWVTTTCPKCGGKARRETNTMPQWAGSSWYYLRYIDPDNTKAMVGSQKERYWMPVDVYVGGVEHATRHLIYARFWHKFLYDIKIASTKEPFMRLKNQGLIAGEDGRKMSKRYGNIINPDDIVERFGADTLRIYEMFMGPFEDGIGWNTDNVMGAKRFLEKVWRVVAQAKKVQSSSLKTKSLKLKTIEKLLHKTIEKVTRDIEHFKFNTAISALMVLVNEMQQAVCADKDYATLVKLLAPFVPHLSEELWHKLGHKTSVHKETWPQAEKRFLKDDDVTLVVQVNGALRRKLDVKRDINEEEAKALALRDSHVASWLQGKTIKNVIFVKDRLINFVISISE